METIYDVQHETIKALRERLAELEDVLIETQTQLEEAKYQLNKVKAYEELQWANYGQGETK